MTRLRGNWLSYLWIAMTILMVYWLLMSGIFGWILLFIFASLYLYKRKTGSRYFIPRRRKRVKVQEDMGFTNDEEMIVLDVGDESKMYTLGFNDAAVGNEIDFHYEDDPHYLMGYEDRAGE